ncbi:MAG: nucleotidyl transferase AbiEii/AbiGii toxin family protein [Candidatus Eremiobacteraeota bacterium]|nr:nucleotidyl transferase AbiEii/AbiGii toxin family protein [Candidatus Eremiobacteraeota bacterium]
MPQEAWEALFERAMIALDSLTHLHKAEWTFGGGTAMRLVYHHRESKDIDIFMHDPQVLMSLSPRVNDTVEELAPRTYTEQSNFLKMHFAEGEVDFILAPRLLVGIPPQRMTILERAVDVDTPAEIVTKKCFYRAADFTARDVFDFAVLLERDRPIVQRNAQIFFAKRELLRRRVEQLRSNAGRVRYAFDSMDIQPEFDHLKDGALELVFEAIAGIT